MRTKSISVYSLTTLDNIIVSLRINHVIEIAHSNVLGNRVRQEFSWLLSFIKAVINWINLLCSLILSFLVIIFVYHL